MISYSVSRIFANCTDYIQALCKLFSQLLAIKYITRAAITTKYKHNDDIDLDLYACKKSVHKTEVTKKLIVYFCFAQCYQ